MNDQADSSSVDETFIVTTLDQARLLSDKFKLRLLRSFAERPANVRDVAEMLGEKPTRLYRHIDALHDAGLLKIVHQQQKRGTVERTFQSVARRFRADPSLFETDSKGPSQGALRDQFHVAADALIAAMSSPSDRTEGLEPICMRVLTRASPQRLKELREMLIDWIDEASNNEPEDHSACSASAMIVFHQDSST